MAVNVDKVYKVVLAIMNREQRGFIPPAQFNRLGRQAELKILEKSFVDYERLTMRSIANPLDYELGRAADRIKEKIEHVTTDSALTFTDGSANLPSDVYRIVNITTNNRTVEVEEMTREEATYLLASRLVSPEEDYPAYFKQGNTIKIFPSSISTATIDYVQVPEGPVWGFTGDGSTSITYDPAGSTDFVLHPSEEKDLVIEILSLAGVVIKDPFIVEAAMQKQAIDLNEENIK